MGTSNDNYEEVTKTNPRNVCGVKIYLGSSTGNMLVDNAESIEKLFKIQNLPVAVHCEEESIIKENSKHIREEYGDNPPSSVHPIIRNEECCYHSSHHAVELAKKYGTRLHVVHVSTAKETGLFDSSITLENKKITSEVCPHHLWFSDKDYVNKGNMIKWNPAIKTEHDKTGLLAALLENKIDTIATDHAPHTHDEKEQAYFSCPSGGPYGTAFPHRYARSTQARENIHRRQLYKKCAMHRPFVSIFKNGDLSVKDIGPTFCWWI